MAAALRQADQLVGREAELAALDEFLAEHRRALILTGEAGIGKTSLWQAGIEAAGRRGIRVLSARASGAEARLSFAALIDLLDGVEVNQLAPVPAPQLRALEVALLRVDPGDVPVESQAISLGFLNALRALAARARLLVAIDDLQWLDSPSADALAFAARRLHGSPVRFLLARRAGRSSSLEGALRPGLQRLQVGPLSLGAMRRMLVERLGLILPRHLLRRVVDSTVGNPLFALEMGRLLAEGGLPGFGEELPVPDSIEELLGTRVRRLRPPIRKLLLALALSPDPSAGQLAAIVGAGALDDAVAAGLLVVDGDRVRPSHPLLPAAARKRSRAGERRSLHSDLARVVDDEGLRVKHLILSADRSDAELAAAAASTAAAASARGVWQEAVELGEHALRLTPPTAGERTERLLALAEYLNLAGELQRSTALVLPEVQSLPPGPIRARAWLLLAGGVVTGNAEIGRYWELALTESKTDESLHGSVLRRLAENTAVIGVSRISEADAWAVEALAVAERSGSDQVGESLQTLGWTRALRGRSIDDLCERFRRLDGLVAPVTTSPERVAGQRLVWRGEAHQARPLLARLLSVSDQRSEPYSFGLLRLHLCELELRIGAWEAAECLLDEWAEDREILVWPMYERCRALLAAGRGLGSEAGQWAAKTLSRSEETGNRWDELEALRARGVAALLAHEPTQAAESLRVVWEHTRREGVDEPGVFPVAPELVEALAEVGELAEARMVTNRLRELAEAQEHPWGLATAKRCAGLVGLASGSYDEDAASSLAAAADEYGFLGLRFDRARSLLLLGRAQRRHRKWAWARSSLEQAAAAFEEIGSPGWLEEVRSELTRVGARRPPPAGELSPAERRVAELAADGLANKQIASSLFVSVKTVEAHLSHAYAKLDVRSRAQLARRLAGG